MPSRDPAFALQKAIFSALAGATSAGANVYDRVPKSDPFPRITIGGSETNANPADCYDGSESFVQIDVWSRAVGFPECKQIADRVSEILHDQTLVLDGHVWELSQLTNAVYSRDPDGLTSRARMTLRVLSQPTG